MAGPAITQPDSPLLTKEQLGQWLNLTPWEARTLTSDPAFVERCAINVAPAGAKYRRLRFVARAVAKHLGIPEYATPRATKAAA